MTMLPHDIREVYAKATCLYDKEKVDKALDDMAVAISVEVSEMAPVFICVVLGGIIPMGHLLTRLDFPLEVAYVHLTRYQGVLVGGVLKWETKISCSLKDRNVVIVDDILDKGVTLAALREICYKDGARTVYTCVLVDKNTARSQGGIIKADFTGLKVEDSYVFGYGMDYKNYLRNAPGIFSVAPQHL